MKKQTDLLDCWENDFRNGISKYCNGYPAVAKSLLKLIPDIKTLLEATATRTRQEDIRVLESIKKGGECYRFDKDRYALKCTCNNCYHFNEAIQKLKSLNK